MRWKRPVSRLSNAFQLRSRHPTAQKTISKRRKPRWDTCSRRFKIPLLAEEGRREAPGWSVRPKRITGLTTPSAPSAQPPLCDSRTFPNQILRIHSDLPPADKRGANIMPRCGIDHCGNRVVYRLHGGIRYIDHDEVSTLYGIEAPQKF